MTALQTGEIRPRKRWFGVAGAVALAGLVVAAVLVIGAVTGFGDALHQVVVPGAAEVDLDPGRNMVYYEHRSAVDGRRFDTGSTVPDLEVTVRSVRTGESIPLEPARADTTYEFGPRAGTGVLVFDIDASGPYHVEAGYPAGGGPEVVLAVGPPVVGRLLGSVFGGIGIALAGFLAATVIAVVTGVRRSDARRRATAAQGWLSAPPESVQQYW